MTPVLEMGTDVTLYEKII